MGSAMRVRPRCEPSGSSSSATARTRSSRTRTRSFPVTEHWSDGDSPGPTTTAPRGTSAVWMSCGSATGSSRRSSRTSRADRPLGELCETAASYQLDGDEYGDGLHQQQRDQNDQLDGCGLKWRGSAQQHPHEGARKGHQTDGPGLVEAGDKCQSGVVARDEKGRVAREQTDRQTRLILPMASSQGIEGTSPGQRSSRHGPTDEA